MQKLKDSHKGNKHTEKTKRKMSETRKGRKITWGDKISKTKIGKYKISKEYVLEIIRENPTISREELRVKCNLKSYTPFLKWGGLKKLKKEIQGNDMHIS